MSASFTEDQEELRRYVRRWLDERASIDEVRLIMETDEGYDPELWKEMGELGWLGMAIPEQYGGAGYGFGELAILCEEMGRGLFPSPFLSAVVMAAYLVEALGSDDQKSALLPGIAAGDVRPTVVSGTSGSTGIRAGGRNGEWELSGSARFVLDGHTADPLLVIASGEQGPAVFVVDGDAGGVARRRLDVMDLTRPQARIDLDSARGVPLGSGDGAEVEKAVEGMKWRAVAALAMEQAGGTQACLDMSVAYAKERHQFGRPIGSFQAIKHMCADMLVAVESARSAAYHLAWAIDHDLDEVPVAVSLAKSYCSDAYFQAAADTIQIHGGIGFTWEHTAHLYLKRAKSSQLLFGDGAHHRSRLAGQLDL